VSEFELINRYFKSLATPRADVLLGIGDDCALLQPPAGKQLAMTADTLVAGVHFPVNTAAYDIGYKALAVNLSDLAAMGAEPAWAVLALTLPEVNAAWLKEFVRGFSELANEFGVQLIGGDTTSGPLSITLQLTGFVSPGQVLRRDTAKPGDKIYVSGTLGDAALGLKQCLGQLAPGHDLAFCVSRLHRPEPRLALGRELLAFSRCGIDVSDGLLADLGHITSASHCAANLYLNQLPLSEELQQYFGNNMDWSVVVAGGDDYELCFTLPSAHAFVLSSIAQKTQTRLTCIGEILPGQGVHSFDESGNEVMFERVGYNHFANSEI
jgi:thiamine-monophosphate kinase